MTISGRKAIHAIIENSEIKHLINVVYLSETQTTTIDLCKKNKVNYEIKPKSFFDENYSDKTRFKYKYAIATLKKPKIISLNDLINKTEEKGFIVILDHIQDPFNLGAILRTCAAANVDGVIIPKYNQAPINHNATLKASQGFSLLVNISIVTNLSQAIDILKKNNYWIYAANINNSSKSFKRIKYPTKKALIMGSEGDGISRLLQNISDYHIHIPIKKGINSLNVSVAAGILIYEMIN